jgi:tetraacyldisaccharide 4'-kinase
MSIKLSERIEKRYMAVLSRPGADQGHGRGVRGVLWTLKQLSRLYLAVVQTRLFLYDKRLLRPHTLGCQVISVGNLTVGGTGKTPVVEVFARELTKEGRKVAILSRGYKKESPPFWQRLKDRLTLSELSMPPRVVSDGHKLLLNSAMSGDEPYMLASNLPNVAVLVDKNRVKSGRYAIDRLGCDTLILDDGFQYLDLKHRVEIVLVDRTNPFGNEHVLPRGILREPIRNIRRADFIFLTKSDGVGSDEIKARLRRLNPKAEIVECRHAPRYLQNVFTRDRKDLAALNGLKVVAVSGIAMPAGFEDELVRRGAVLLERFRFADHHRYSQQEVIDIVNAAQRLNADAILTTEKDTVRFPRLERCDVDIYFLRVDIDLLTGAEDFRQCIERICFR